VNMRTKRNVSLCFEPLEDRCVPAYLVSTPGPFTVVGISDQAYTGPPGWQFQLSASIVATSDRYAVPGAPAAPLQVVTSIPSPFQQMSMPTSIEWNLLCNQFPNMVFGLPLDAANNSLTLANNSLIIKDAEALGPSKQNAADLANPNIGPKVGQSLFLQYNPSGVDPAAANIHWLQFVTSSFPAGGNPAGLVIDNGGANTPWYDTLGTADGTGFHDLPGGFVQATPQTFQAHLFPVAFANNAWRVWQGVSWGWKTDRAPLRVRAANAQGLEGNSGTTVLTFPVTLDGPADDTVTVDYSTADGTGGSAAATTADNDYQAKSGTITFNPGETSKTVTILVNGDNKYEQNETFFVSLSNPTNADIADDQGVGTIVNDDPVPKISVGDVTHAEGNSGATAFAFPVSLSNPSSQTITVSYYTADYTASFPDNDYAPTSGTLTFNPGETLKWIVVLVNGDTKFELTEKFMVYLYGPTNASIFDNQGIGTILNDDLQPKIIINNVGQAEGNSGTTAFTFTVSLTNPSYQAITFHYATADGSATTADHDYAANVGNLTIPAGQTTKTITVLVYGDTKYEPNETFLVNLSSATNASIQDSQGIGVIMNDDGWPTITISDVSRVEGNSGTSAFTFIVALSNPTFQTVTVHYATINGSATAPGDYVAASGTLTFQPGQVGRAINVSVVGDTIWEPDEVFYVNLFNASYATIADGQGKGTIINDDLTPPKIWINDVAQLEGNIGSTSFVFTVYLTSASTQTVSVSYATANGTATASSGDYVAGSSTVSFAPGQTSRTITVLVVGDTTEEPDETFFVNLWNPVNATIADSQGQGTIQNDDVGPPPTSVSIADVAQLEGNSGTTNFVFTVSLTNVTTQPVTVYYQTADGTALAGSDYVYQNTSVTIPAGQLTGTIMIPVIGDTYLEADEYFYVNITSVTNASIFDGQATGTIMNDDMLPHLSVNNATQPRGNGGMTAFTFTVSLSAPSSAPISVDYATADGAATAPNDYTAASGTLTFASGETTQTVTVYGNASFSPDNWFFLNLSNAGNAMLLEPQGHGMVINDDSPPPAISISDVAAMEGDSGATPFVFTVSLSEASTQTVTVDYATADGSATAPGDYAAGSGTVTFLPGETSHSIEVAVLGNTSVESDKSFSVNLTNASNATLADDTGQGTIVNDDSPGPDNLPPVPQDDFAATPMDVPVTIGVLANDADPDNDTLTVESASPGSHGNANVNPDGTVTYTPNGGMGFRGTDSFSYTVSDGRGGSASATVFVMVGGDNSPPVAVDDSAVTAIDTPVTISVLANDSDPDGDPLTVESVTPAEYGNAVLNPDGTVTYTPNGGMGFEGIDTFMYTISDGNGGTASATVTVTVESLGGGNHPPVAQNDSAVTAEDTPVTISVLANDSDPDGDPLYIIAVEPPANGDAVVNSDFTVTYTPHGGMGFQGIDTFAYTISDGNGGTASATVTVTVGQPQFFVGAEIATDVGSLTAEQLQPLVTEAIGQLRSAGFDVAGLEHASFQVTNLQGSLLGVTYQNTIWIDENAAGHGWYTGGVNGGPVSGRMASGELLIDTNSRVDLLTVVTHELGHVLGFASINAAVNPNDWMTATLPAGVRRLPGQLSPSQPVVANLFGELPASIFRHVPVANWTATLPTSWVLPVETAQLQSKLAWLEAPNDARDWYFASALEDSDSVEASLIGDGWVALFDNDAASEVVGAWQSDSNSDPMP
jgi:Bacterial Ig domain/Calx-beta domain